MLEQSAQADLIHRMDTVQIWKGTNRIKVLKENLNENIKKLCNINTHLFILTTSNNFYHARIAYNPRLFDEEDDWEEQVHFQLEASIKPKDIDCNNDTLYVVDQNGKILIYNETLELQNDLLLVERKTCCHGHTASKRPARASKVSVGEYGNLFITENGQLWGSGNMPEIGINTPVHEPLKVAFFENRYAHYCSVGNDFALVVVGKRLISDRTDSDYEEEMDAPNPNCSNCLSALPSSVSQNSLSENCPFGLPLPASYDIESISSSSISSSELKNCNSLAEAGKAENIIFRNTKAARDYLTRQFSWTSAPEENLLDCSETATRILQKNVSSMANLVYEGVKTVGDKAVTLSRHVSSSSDSNERTEATKETPMPRVMSNDEFVWSLSQCTDDKEMSERDLEERCNHIVKMGSALIDNEVWTWGNIVYGQLGLGDIIKRERPMIITKLSNIGAQKVTVQSYHAGILTLDGRAFLWGKNNDNQVSIETTIDQSSPRLFPMEGDNRIKDLACCGSYTSILTSNHILKYMGKHANNKVVNLHIQEHSPQFERNEETMTNADQIGSLLISSKEYTLLNHMPMLNDFVTNDLTCEQRFLEEMITVQSNLIKPLLKKTLSSHNASYLLYQQLCQEYIDLLHFTAANVKSLCDFSSKCISECDVIMLKYVEEHIRIYQSYLNTIHCIVSLSSCASMTKLIDVPVCLYRLLNISTNGDKNSDEFVITQLLTHPLERIQFYENFTHLFVKNTSKVRPDIPSKWTMLIEDQIAKKEEANQTKAFWLNSGKSIDHLKAPLRRILRHSHNSPLLLQNASRFSSNWFILMSDVFIHMNGSHANVHDLRTIWVEPLEGTASNQYLITLKMPEDIMELYTTEAKHMTEWFHALQNAIKRALKKEAAHQPPAIRTASHTFIKSRTLKDAVYVGQWLNGKMHGKGTLKWPDGSTYNGQFSNHQMHGIGQLEDLNSVYKGQWKEGVQNGFGIINYASGDTYRGYFKHGEPHGHGYMKQGHFMSNAASIYIGDWVFGQRDGYGIMDNIITGEKYLGNWSENKKHGNGLIVTADGVYYEGIFNQDMLLGHGLMILDDGTHYEGDFRGIGVLNGKGILRLRSGHVLEGSMSGSWNEGIKISSGTLTLPKHDSDVKSNTFSTFCTPVEQKWKGLFKHYHQLLGLSNEIPKSHIPLTDTRKAWQNVAIIISNQHSGVIRKERYNSIENSLQSLDKIPGFGMESLDLGSYQEIKEYLKHAFDCSTHPLGTLLNDLTEAFTTAYDSHAHCLLLSHAVRELHFITIRLYDVVRLLFPALPQAGKEVFLDDQDEECGLVSCQALLHPIILPRVHSALFTLYTLNNKSQDSQYWKRLLEWNKQPDYTLMAFLHIDQKFLRNLINSSLSHAARDQMYPEAVETLQLLLTTFSPMAKLFVIKQTFQKLTVCVQKDVGEKIVWSMDDLFPVFQYIVVRARIQQLGSELAFIEDFMEASLESGELGIMFTTLKACYYHILDEKLSTH